MSKINCENQVVGVNCARLRKMKEQHLAFASFSSNDSEDVKCLRDLTNLLDPTIDDPTPAYIKYLRLDAFMVSLYCESQMESFLQCKNRIISIDATGNMVKNQDKKRTFYYAAVYRSELTGSIIPLIEFFLTSMTLLLCQM